MAWSVDRDVTCEATGGRECYVGEWVGDLEICEGRVGVNKVIIVVAMGWVATYKLAIRC